jgi:hypothetical protein
MSLIKKIFKAIFGNEPKKQIDLESKVLEKDNSNIEKFETIKTLETKRYSIERRKRYLNLKRTYKRNRTEILNEVFDLDFYNNDTDIVRAHLIAEGNITNCIAIEVYSIDRLSAIIYQLRKRGMQIKSFRDKQYLHKCDYLNYILTNSPYEND